MLEHRKLSISMLFSRKLQLKSKLAIWILFITIIGTVLCEKANHSLNVLTLTNEKFEEEVNRKPFIVMFYLPNCPTCNKTTKLWQDLAKIINESENADIGIAEVDCTIETELCRDKCKPKDNDRCLQTSPTWGNDFTCMTSSTYCLEYGKDMKRCCPDTCGSGVFTEDDCKQFDGKGTCSYPNDAQSRCARSFLNATTTQSTSSTPKTTPATITTSENKLGLSVGFNKSEGSVCDGTTKKGDWNTNFDLQFGREILSSCRSFCSQNKECKGFTFNPKPRPNDRACFWKTDFPMKIKTNDYLRKSGQSCVIKDCENDECDPNVKTSPDNIFFVDCYPPYSVIRQPGATVFSPNYPKSYGDNLDCQTVFEFENRISIEFKEFNLGESYVYDWIKIYDGNSTESDLIGKNLNGKYIPHPIESKGTSMTLQFNSGSYSHGKGFKIVAYQVECQNDEDCNIAKPFCNERGFCGGRCSRNPCANGGSCVELDGNDYTCLCHINCYGNNCENCTSAKFSFDLEQPALMFFQKGFNSSLQYFGPRNVPDLMSFIKDQTGGGPTMIKTESELVLEAGCKEKKWIYSSGRAERYDLIASGHLVEKRVCIGKNYRKYFAPQDEDTKVHSTIEYQQIRDVDAKKQTMSFDLLLTLRWLDPNIVTNFTEKDIKSDGIILRPEKIDMLWTPDLYIWNRTTVKNKDEWAFLKSSKVLSTNSINEQEGVYGRTTVELKYVIKTTIYCKFEYSLYPMDKQNCLVKIGSGSGGSIFTLFDKESSYHSTVTYNAVGLSLDITFFGQENHDRGEKVGFKIEMKRLMTPFLLKYYIPCMAIVIVSEIGFMVPLTAIPGRVALLVTNFLTLVNLFIYQMSESPSASDFNRIGEYLLVSLAFVVIAMLEFAFVILLNHYANLKKNHGKDVAKDKNYTKGCNTKAMYLLNKLNREKKATNNLAPPIQIIDFIAFWVHFVSFLMFNMIYWSRNN